jgi:hypothetical protein
MICNRVIKHALKVLPHLLGGSYRSVVGFHPKKLLCYAGFLPKELARPADEDDTYLFRLLR